ncbi:LLM class flavin-dependent oxidoreductase [Streptomyces sp. HNM0575]|nr:LLM class flavin-dependent oxidoreductase [Streptomyces sp. HNM0575]
MDLLLRWLREERVGADGERYRFREVDVVPRCDEPFALAHDVGGQGAGHQVTGAGDLPARDAPAADTTADAPGETAPGEGHTGPAPSRPASHPAVVVACTSPTSVRLAARRCLPMLLGMHCGDAEKAEVVALWRREAREAGHDPDEIARAAALHISAGVAQVADTTAEAAESLTKAMPGWFRTGLGAHRTVDDRNRTMRDPLAYTELLCGLHPVGTPRLCADRLAATYERTGIGRFALLVEGTGDLAATERNVQRLGEEVLALLPPGP